MSVAEARAGAEAIIQRAVSRAGSLPPASLIRAALTPKLLAATRRRIAEASPGDIAVLRWPELLLFLHFNTTTAIADFDAVISTLHDASPPKARSRFLDFLTARPDDDQRWSSRMFECFVQGRLVRASFKCEIEVPAEEDKPKGRLVDIRIKPDERWINVECATLTARDEDRRSWSRELDVWRRSGSEQPGVWERDPTKDRDRVWDMVYEKLAKDRDPTRTQLPAGCPNLLALSIEPGIWPRRAADEIVGPAVAELLSASSPGRARAEVREWITGGRDWKHFSEANAADPAAMETRMAALLAAPARLGAVLLFDRLRLAGIVVNEHGAPGSRINEQELAGLREHLGQPPEWTR